MPYSYDPQIVAKSMQKTITVGIDLLFNWPIVSCYCSAVVSFACSLKGHYIINSLI